MIGIVTHGYVFFQDAFSHDGLNAFYAGLIEDKWMISLGRYMVPVYRNIFRGDIALPWIIGLLSLLWLSIVSYLIAQMLEIESKTSIILTVAGWSSSLIATCFLGGIQLVSLGVIGEYVGKIYLETKGRPRYIISERTDDTTTSSSKNTQ